MSITDFELLQKIGEGSFARVYKAKRINDKKYYALKQIYINQLDQKLKQNSLNQVRFLASFSCQNIIRYYQAFFQTMNHLLVIVMQYAQNGDLSKLIKAKKSKGQHFSQLQIWKMIISVVHGLNYLHSHSIIHRDIKPQNIFITNGQYKIGDLNVSKIKLSNLQELTQVGTPAYASPEIWDNANYDNKCDVWSLGCVAYQMAALQPPFIGDGMDKLYTQITRGKIKTLPPRYSKQLSQIIQKCLQKQPNKRPTVVQLKSYFTIKMYENIFFKSEELAQENLQFGNLLKTITFNGDHNLTHLQLPQPHYQNQEMRKLQNIGQAKESIIGQLVKIQNEQNRLQSNINNKQKRQSFSIIGPNHIQIVNNQKNKIQIKQELYQNGNNKYQNIFYLPFKKLSQFNRIKKYQINSEVQKKINKQLLIDQKFCFYQQHKKIQQLQNFQKLAFKSQKHSSQQKCQKRIKKNSQTHANTIKNRRSSPRTQLSAKKREEFQKLDEEQYKFKNQWGASFGKQQSDDNTKQNVRCNIDANNILMQKIANKIGITNRIEKKDIKQATTQQIPDKYIPKYIQKIQHKQNEKIKYSKSTSHTKLKKRIFFNSQLQNSFNRQLMRRIKQILKVIKI